MPTTGLNSFDRAVHVANRWVASVAHAFGTDDRLFAYRVLRASAGAVAGRADAVETRATPMPDERLARVERGWSALNEAVRELVHGLEPAGRAARTRFCCPVASSGGMPDRVEYRGVR